MKVYAVKETLWGYDAVTVSVFSSWENAEKAIKKYEHSFPEFDFEIEEFEVDKE